MAARADLLSVAAFNLRSEEDRFNGLLLSESSLGKSNGPDEVGTGGEGGGEEARLYKHVSGTAHPFLA